MILDRNNIGVQKLTQKEMRSTNGGWVFVVGFLLGVAFYLLQDY